MLGDNLKKYRKMKNLSQEELAEALDVSRQSISLWETGKTQPSVDTLSKLAIMLGVSVDTLLTKELQQEVANEKTLEQYTGNSNVATSKTHEYAAKSKPFFAACLVVLLVIGAAFVGWKWFFNSTPFVDDPAAIEQASQSVVMLNCYDKAGELYSTGSGFAMFEDNVIVTNYHVIEDNVYRIVIDTESGASFEADYVLVSDKENDIAILGCKTATNLVLLEAGATDSLQKGEKLVAIGSPLGLMNTVSSGVFSGYVNNGELQFTASISSGSSGGALFDNEGKVLGITYASFEAGQNLNLAIPIEQVNELWQKRNSSSKLSVRSFYQQQTPTYSVEYVLKNFDKLDNRDFYVKGWILSHSYQEWCDEENWDRREGWAEMCDVNYSSIVTISATAKRDSFSELGKIMEKYDIWYGAGEVLNAIERVEDGEMIVIGPISRHYLDSNYVRISYNQN